MREIDLETAVHEIVAPTRRLRERTKPPKDYPFFVIVGSGISHPEIPLASGIEQFCRKEIADQGLKMPPEDGSPLDRYQSCFEQAFPHAADRQDFLHSKVHKVPISAANFRLAHLLGEAKLTNLVFTPNFDEMLSRALRLLGYDVVVCDHPKTTQRIDPSRSELQIVHVHGTHWFYDCCNLKGEIEGQARSDSDDSVSMGQLLDRVLAERSPLIIGYSGWEGDVLMSALQRRLRQRTLPHNLYWFCFKRSDADTLPKWLKEHLSARLVFPRTETARPEEASIQDALKRGPQRTLPQAAPTQSGVQGSTGEPTMPARQVFEALSRGLELTSPPLTAEPLDFFYGLLETNLKADEQGKETAKDLYAIGEVLSRVRDGARLEREHREHGTKSLVRVNDAVRRSAYSEAVAAAKEISLAGLTASQASDLEAALEKVFLNTVDMDAAVGLDACALRIELNSLAEDPEAPLKLARSLNGKGYCLAHLGRPEEAIVAYDQVAQRFGDSSEAALNEQVAKSLFNKGVALGEAGRSEAAIAAYAEVVRRFGNAAEAPLRELVAWALLNEGVDLGESGQGEAAIAAYAEVVRRFGDANEGPLRELLAWALFNKGVALGQTGQLVAATAAYAEVVQRFGDSSEAPLRTLVAWALFNQGVDLVQGGRREAAIAAYDDLARRFGDSGEASHREMVAMALVNKGSALAEEGQSEAGCAAYDEVVHRFGDASEATLREQVAMALNGKGQVLQKSDQADAALTSYDEVIRRFGDAGEAPLREQLAGALFNRGIALEKAGQTEAALAAYDEVLRRFGDAGEAPLREAVARALVSKGVALGKAGQTEAELAAYDEVVRRFIDASEAPLREQVLVALKSKSSLLLEHGHGAGGASAWAEALKAAAKSIELGGRHYNYACALALTGSIDEALVELEGCLTRGEISREHVAEDRDWESLRENSSFKSLLESAAGSLLPAAGGDHGITKVTSPAGPL